MKTRTLLLIASYAFSVIGLTDSIGVFSLAAAPASLLIGLPFTVTGVSSGTLAALGALKLLAATALGLSYTGTGIDGGQYGGGTSYGGGASYGGGGGGYGGGNSAYAGGSYGGSDGYGGGGGAYGGGNIYKRSVDNKIGNMELYFHIINEVDTNHCALRLICELEATKDKTKLQDDERMILALFSGKAKEIPLAQLKTPSGPYQLAAFIGSSSSVPECGKFYSKCPYTGVQMMTALRQASSQQQ